MASVYLDSASGAPLHPRVLDGFMEALQTFSEGNPGLLANPNSLHRVAQRSRQLLQGTSTLVLESLGLPEKDYAVLFTSGGTEAIQTAVRSTLFQEEQGSSSWHLSAIEHSCNRDLIPEARRRGVHVGLFGLDERGQVQGLSDTVRASGPGLISLLSVQNETGVTSHILGGSQIAKHSRIPICIDHVAGWGKVKVPFHEIQPDFIAVSGHKIGAFAGIGALVYRRETARFSPLMPGSQQKGLRGGTENTAGVLSLKLALEGKAQDPDSPLRVRALRDRFEAELKTRFPEVRIIGEQADRSPYISSVCWSGHSKPLDLVTRLDLQGIAVSAGSACQSAVPRPSFVLLHYGLSEMDARNTIRVSFHDQTRWNELERLILALERLLGPRQGGSHGP